MKIGILVADRVRAELVARHGEYSDMFAGLLAEAGPEAEYPSYDVDLGRLPERLDDCDGYVITGSRYSVYDKLGWLDEFKAFVRGLLEERRPLLAVCFGHQLVADLLGGRVEPAARGWTLGVRRTRIEDGFPWTGAGTDSLRLIHSHQDQVLDLPEGAELVGTNDACPVSMYRVGSHVMSCQGHPEFSRDYATELYDARREIFGDELWRQARGSLDEPTDEELLARWALDFFSAGGRPR